MGSLKKYNNSNLASSNMVNARRDEVERLERQRLEVNRKLEHLMKKYSMLTGDRKVARRKMKVGNALNDWNLNINASGVKPPMPTWEKAFIIASVAAVVLFIGCAIYMVFGEEIVNALTKFANDIFVPI